MITDPGQRSSRHAHRPDQARSVQAARVLNSYQHRLWHARNLRAARTRSTACSTASGVSTARHSSGSVWPCGAAN